MINTTKIITMSTIVSVMLTSSAYAGKVISDAVDPQNPIIIENKQFGFGGWNFDNIDVRIVDIDDFSTPLPGTEFNTTTGVYTPMGENMSFEADIYDISYASGSPVVGTTIMAHLHGKDWPVGEPGGIKVINGDTKTKGGKPENCLMTTSYLEFQDMSDDTSGTGYLDAWPTMPNPVICSSPFQTHKRYKFNLLPSTVDGVSLGEYGEPVDLVFNLDPTDTDTEIRRYQIFQKVNNYTGRRLDGIKIEVLDENGTQNPALTLSLGYGEGLDDSDIPDGSDIWDITDLANYAHGLWGPIDDHFTEPGFFDYKRAYFPVELDDNNWTISYSGDMLGGNYQEIFGNWLPSIWEPNGIFWDEDQNPATDNILQAFYGVPPGETELAWWKSVVDVTDPKKPVYTWVKASEADLASWQGEWYNEGPIEDVLNLGLNYIVNVGANADIGDTFTIRITPHVDTDQTPPSSYVDLGNVVGTADFNNDGIADILWRNEDANGTYIWYMENHGSHETKILNEVSSDWDIEGAADFNANGTADILWRNSVDGRTYIWYMNTNGTYSSKNIGTVSGVWDIEGAADFNANGTADILWRNTADGRTYVWYMNSTGTYSSKNIGTVSSIWDIENAADFNANGTADILWRNVKDGRTYIWYMNTNGTYSSKNIGTVSGVWDIEGADKFNAGSIADILWRNTADGRTYIWYMNSTGTYSSKNIGTVSTEWDIKGTADFNADGIADILWRNTSDGRTYLWYMNSNGTYTTLNISSSI